MESSLVLLDESHRNQILKFWRSKREIYGQVIEPDEDRINAKFNSFFTRSKDIYRIYGIMNPAGDLVFTIGVVMWDSLPYYSFIELTSLTGSGLSHKIKEFMSQGINQLLSDMLKVKRHTFYYIFERSRVNKNVEWDDGHSHSYQKFISETDKYDYSTELIVKPGETPEFATYWRLMGSRTHKVELIIRRGILKPHFMKELFDR